MLIRCYDGRVLNSRHIRSYVVEDAANARHYANGSGTTQHPAAPQSGFVVVAWVSGSKAFLTDGLLIESEAHRVLDALLLAYADGARAFDATTN